DGNRDAGGGDHVDDLRRVDVVVGGHGAAVAGGDAAVEVLAHRLDREIFETARIRIVGVIDEHMNVAVVSLGDLEADVDVLARVGVRVFVPGQAADDVAALAHGFVEQLGRAGIARDALLR